MASLQTLRNKGGVIVAVIIGIALLAFVLGDMLTSGSTLFGNSANNVGEINGKSITANQYGNQINYLTEIQKISSGSESLSEEQSQAIQSQAWEQLVRQYAVEPALEAAGVTVSPDEMSALVTGQNISPIIQQVFTNPQTGYFEPQYLRQFVEGMDNDPSGRMQMFWDYMQGEVSSQAIMMKYKTLIDKAVYVTKQQADYMAAIESDSYSVRFVAENYASIADSTIAVSDAEAKAFYEKNKAAFFRQTSRTIEYVVFEALPSDADYAAADKYITELAQEFAQSANIDQFVSLNSQNPFDSRYYKEGELSGPLNGYAFSDTTSKIYGPNLVGDEYTMARVSDIRVLPDTVNISHIVLASTDKSKADSLASALRTAKTEEWAVAAATYSLDTQTAQAAGLIGDLDPQTMGVEFAEPLYKTAKGSIVVVPTKNAIHIIKVNNRIGDSKKVKVGVIRYKIEPSKDTRNITFAKASDFEKSATSKGFDAVVAESALSKRSVNVGPNDRTIQGLPASRELARWAYNNQVGDKSAIMEFGDNFVVASITAVNDRGIAPFEASKDAAISMVRKEKKGEMLAAKLAGATSVDELASKLSLTPIDAADINFSTFIVPEIGYDPAFAGGVCGAAKNSGVIKPIIGSVAVYAAQVTGTTSSPIDPMVEKQKLSAEREQSAFMSAYQNLLEKSKIEDQRYKFY